MKLAIRTPRDIGRSRNTARAGLTLMEVLVSIFIMAIGMLALLTLFPLGAIRMDQAIRDERSAQAAIQATELAKILDLANDPAVRFALTDPNWTGGTPPDGLSTTPGPSKAVLVDPLGISPFLDASNNVSRVASNYANNYYEFFTITDELTFLNGAGVPRTFSSGSATSTTTTIGREIRFTWAYLLQRPMVQNAGITNYTVCVYNRRPLAGTLEFTLPSATINVSDSTISYVTTDPSTVKQILPGQWVLDCTIAKSVAAAAGGGPATVVPLANFYRINGVRAGSTASETILDVQGPIRGYDKLNLTPDPNTGKIKYTGTGTNLPTLVIQDGLVEAIDVGPLR
jgi:hypothetical protein